MILQFLRILRNFVPYPLYFGCFWVLFLCWALFVALVGFVVCLNLFAVLVVLVYVDLGFPDLILIVCFARFLVWFYMN